VINRGIPLVRILEDIREKISDLPGLDPSENPVWKLNRNQDIWPVIGCDNFQALVWRSAVAGRPSLLLIEGGDDSGKSFCVELLLDMLPDGGHLKVRLNAEAISKMDPAKLAATICATAGAKIPDLSSPAEMNSTLTVWLKDEVMNKIIAALESVRNNRLVWISITELNQFEIQDAGTSQLLLMLYESLLNLNWLRIVLDGMKGDIPASLSRTTERYRTAPIMPAEIATYFRRFVTFSDLLEDSTYIAAAAKSLDRLYQTDLTRNPATALETLALNIKNFGQDYKESYESALRG
jgi:hypothetical protein